MERVVLLLYQGGLVLEGGGMRGLFTTGVLDAFLENDVGFSHCIGVSAGACHGVSYVCGQVGRSRDVSVDYLQDKHYCGLYSLLTTGNIFNPKMVYETIPREHYPLDVAHYKASGAALYAVVTDCVTGKPVYRLIDDPMADLHWIRASASMPLVSRMVRLQGGKYLDGGIADAIPLAKGMELAGEKAVVVLTQHKGYRKQPDSLLPVMKLYYAKCPQLVQCLQNRHLAYNRSLSLVEELEQQGRIFVIRPPVPITVHRVEKDKEKLVKLYQQGYRQGQQQLASLLEYLKETRPALGAEK